MNRWSKYEFKNGKIAKNRVVVPPMASQTADEKGFATNATIEHYKSLSQSEAGIVFVEYSYIHQSGKGEPNQLGVNLSSQQRGLQQIAKEIKKHKALAAIQLVHVGGKTSSSLTGQSLIAPSELATPVKGRILEVPEAATDKSISKLLEWYLNSVRLAVNSGFDIVELHAAHGYGLNQWLSPVTNLSLIHI